MNGVEVWNQTDVLDSDYNTQVADGRTTNSYYNGIGYWTTDRVDMLGEVMHVANWDIELTPNDILDSNPPMRMETDGTITVTEVEEVGVVGEGEGPIQTETNTIGLWKLNGPDISAAGEDSGPSGYDMYVETGAPGFGVDGYGKDVKSDGFDEGVEFYVSSTTDNLKNDATLLSVDPLTVEIIFWSDTMRGGDETAGGLAGTCFYTGSPSFNRGWGIYTYNGNDTYLDIFNGSSFYKGIPTPVATWGSKWIYCVARFDSANSDSSNNYGYLNMGRIEEDASTIAHTSTGGGWSTLSMVTSSTAFGIGQYLHDVVYNTRSMDGIISTVHVMNEFKDDAWVEARFTAVKEWAASIYGLQPNGTLTVNEIEEF